MLDIRLASHGFDRQAFSSAEEVVQHFGCMQAQDTKRAKWCIGSRVPGSTLEDIHKALADGSIVRTRPMRGTLHYMDPKHVRWIVKLCASKTLNGFKKRREYLGITDQQAEKALKIFEKNMKGGRIVARSDIKEILESGGIPMQKQRVYHLTCYAGTLGLICFGPPGENGEDTFVWLDDWIPNTKQLSDEEQLATLARMYYRGHGPATVDDFARWTGLGKTVSKLALGYIQKELKTIEENGNIYYYIDLKFSKERDLRLLGGFDEYFIGYKDRSVVAKEPKKFFTVNGIFPPLILQDGIVIGKRKREFKKDYIKFIFFVNKKIDVKFLESQATIFSKFQGIEDIKIDIKSL